MSSTNSTKTTWTSGVHHVGLAVSDLQASRRFFVDALGFSVVAEDKEYPSVFVSDGANMITLWQVKDSTTATPFDRRGNVGLHHLALRVSSQEKLHGLHEVLKATDGVTIETPPQAYEDFGFHMFITEASGIRLEFINWTA